MGREEHQSLVDLIYRHEAGKYDFMAKNVEYRDRKTGLVMGEIDLLGFRDGKYDLYEVKSYGDKAGKTRAALQLNRARENLGLEIANMYYLCIDKSKIRQELV